MIQEIIVIGVFLFLITLTLATFYLLKTEDNTTNKVVSKTSDFIAKLSYIQSLIDDYIKESGFVIMMQIVDEKIRIYNYSNFEIKLDTLEEAEAFIWGMLNGAQIQRGEQYANISK